MILSIMSLITPYQSCLTAPLLMEMTRWRNEPSSTLVAAGKRLVSEVGYVLIALVGLVEGVARLIFALPFHLCLNEENIKGVHQGIALNFQLSLIALGSLIYNPFSEHLSLDWCSASNNVSTT